MPNGQHTSPEFIHSFQTGEEEAFDLYFLKYFSTLCFFAGNYLKNEEEAKDIVQESFIKLWNRRAAIKNSPAIKSYLYTIVRNDCIDKLNAKKKEGLLIDSVAYQQDEWETENISEVIHAELIGSIHNLINELPEKMQQVFKLYYLSGKNYSEIATELHTTPETVRKQKSRALVLLKEKLPTVLLLFFYFLH